MVNVLRLTSENGKHRHTRKFYITHKHNPEKFLQLCRAEEETESESSENSEEEESSDEEKSVHFNEVDFSEQSSEDDEEDQDFSEQSSEDDEEDQDFSGQSSEDDEELEVADSYENEQFLEDVPSPPLSPPLERYSPPHNRYSPPHVEEAPVYEARYSPSQPDAGCSYSPPSYSDSEDTPPSFSDDYSDFSD